jgi:hypothetical protein
VKQQLLLFFVMREEANAKAIVKHFDLMIWSKVPEL